MRYWVYHDARVLGPFSKEDLASVPGLDQDTLISKADAASGAREQDWIALADLPELAELYSAGTGVSLAPAAENVLAGFNVFRDESNQFLEKVGYPEAWISGVFEDSTIFDSQAGIAGGFGMGIAPHPDSKLVADLENRLAQLTMKSEEYEKNQNAILERLGEKDKTIKDLRSLLTSRKADAAAPPAVEAKTPEPEPIAKTPEPEPIAKTPEPEPIAQPPEPEVVDPSLPVSEAGPHDQEEPASPRDSARSEVPPPDAGAEPPAPTGMEAPAPAAEEAPPPVEESVVPETEVMASVAAMPEVQDFVPPTPEEASPAPAEAAPLEPPPIEASPAAEELPLTAPPMAAPAAEAPAQEAPPLSGPATDPPEITSLEPPASEQASPADLEAPPLVASSDVKGDTGKSQPMDPGPMDQPKTMVFDAPPLGAPPAEAPGTEPLPLTQPPSLASGALPGQAPTPMPIPLGGAATPTPGQTTPMPAMGQPDIPKNVLQGMGVGGTTTPIPGMPTPGGSQSFEELMGKPATAVPQLTPSAPGMAKTGLIQTPSVTKPEEKTDTSPSKLKQFMSKKVLVGLGLAVVILVVLMLLFFRNPKQVQQMVDMSPPNQSAQGDLNAGGEGRAQGSPPQSPFAQRAAPTGSASSFPKREEAPAPAAAPPAPPPQAASGGDFIQDEQIQAMEFVKSYQLSGAKGDIGGWLNYSFPPPNMPQWSANGISKNVWVVEYLVFKSPRSKKPEITYSFEVNLKTKILKALNAPTKSLLAGSQRKRKASSRRGTRALRPLPRDEDLATAAPQDSGGFNNPGAGGF